MTRAPEPPSVGGVPASIAAIMAAIRQDVTARPAGPAAPPPADEVGDPPAAPPVPPAAPRAGGAGAAPGPLPPHLDAEARALLAPMIRQWLDTHRQPAPRSGV